MKANLATSLIAYARGGVRKQLLVLCLLTLCAGNMWGGTRRIYFDYSDVTMWDGDGALMRVHCWGGNVSDADYDMSAVEGQTALVYADINEGHTSLCFYRQDPNSNTWWNKTQDWGKIGAYNRFKIKNGQGSYGDDYEKYLWADSDAAIRWTPNVAIDGLLDPLNPHNQAFDNNGEYTVTLAARTTYEFRILNGSALYGLENHVWTSSVSKYTLYKNQYQIRLCTAGEGEYKFTWDNTNKQLSVTYPSVSHPSIDYCYVIDYNWTPSANLHVWNCTSELVGVWNGGSTIAGSTWPGAAISNKTTIGGQSYFYIAPGEYANFLVSKSGHETDRSGDLTTSDGYGKRRYWKDASDGWIWDTFTVRIQLENNGADAGHKGTEYQDVAFNSDVLSDITCPEKTHYDFQGYYTEVGGTGTQVIDKHGHWIESVEGYTDAEKRWIHEGTSTTLYAKWNEDLHTVNVAVSPVGAGSVQISSSDISKVENIGIATKSDEMTAVPANAAWVFKEWQISSNDVHLDLETYTTTGTTMKINATANGQTLTAFFERRYGLIGSLNEEGDPDGGMPNKNGETWGVERSADYEADFEVIGFTALGAGDGTGVDLQCTRYLLANKQYKFQVVDRSTIGRDRFCLEENGSAVLEPGNSVTLTYKEKVNANVLLNTEGEGYYTFKITNISNDGNYYPTLTVIRPQQVNFGQKYQDIDGTLHTGTTGGTAAATAGSALSSGVYVTYNTSVTHTATATSPGYTFAGWWSSDAFEGDAFSNTNPMTYAVTSGDNAYAKFVEKATAVTLSNDGHGHVEIDGMTVSSTTVGITTHRELTAVPDEGYKFNSWTIVSGNDIALSSTSTNPTTLTGLGAGAASGQEVHANFIERWIVQPEVGEWGYAYFTIEHIEEVGGKTIGYVDITLEANTNYQFSVVDRDGDVKYKNGSDQVYYMTNGNSHNWGFATDKSFYCGITTAGAGVYRFTWNITDKKMTVTYPNFIIYRTGDKADDPRAQNTDVESYAGGTISQAIEFRMRVNRLDQWYTLCLPFTVTAVKVWDEEDGQYYDIVPYYRTGDKYYTGHYIIRTPVSTTDFAIENFDSRDRWVDPSSAVGYLPSANTPYIIQWHDSWFQNKYISFFGTAGQIIPTAMDKGSYASSDETVNIYGNNSMTTGTVRDAYLLDPSYGTDGAWMREEIGTDRSVLPFECFILANEKTTAKYRVLRRDMADNTPTGLDTLFKTEDTASKVLINNRIYIIRGGKMYTIQGTFVKEVE